MVFIKVIRGINGGERCVVGGGDSVSRLDYSHLKDVSRAVTIEFNTKYVLCIT